MTRLALADVVGVLRLSDAGPPVDDLAVDVLVVDGEDAPPAVVEQRHAVVVVAEGALLTGAGAPRCLVERDRVRPHGIAPSGDDVPTVAARHGHRIEGVGGDRLEGDAPGRRTGGKRRKAGRAHDECRGAERNRAAEEATARDRVPGEPVEIGPFRPGVVHLVEVVERNGRFGCGVRGVVHVHLRGFTETGPGPGRTCMPGITPEYMQCDHSETANRRQFRKRCGSPTYHVYMEWSSMTLSTRRVSRCRILNERTWPIGLV